MLGQLHPNSVKEAEKQVHLVERQSSRLPQHFDSHGVRGRNTTPSLQVTSQIPSLASRGCNQMPGQSLPALDSPRHLPVPAPDWRSPPAPRASVQAHLDGIDPSLTGHGAPSLTTVDPMVALPAAEL